jgi:hypothetical protein
LLPLFGLFIWEFEEGIQLLLDRLERLQPTPRTHKLRAI